jgi:hypothetical protein
MAYSCGVPFSCLNDQQLWIGRQSELICSEVRKEGLSLTDMRWNCISSWLICKRRIEELGSIL